MGALGINKRGNQMIRAVVYMAIRDGIGESPEWPDTETTAYIKKTTKRLSRKLGIDYPETEKRWPVVRIGKFDITEIVD